MKVLLFISLALSLLACGEEEKTKADNSTGPAATEVATDKSTEPAAAEAAQVTKIEIESTDQMKYNLSELKAKAGAKVSLTLKHTGSLPVTAMGHNIVILAAGVSSDEFVVKANAAGPEKNYLHDGANVVVASKVIGGGESVTVEFTAPAAGSYDYLCSVPGHYFMMKGKFIVE
jgi:azurin